MMNLSAAGCIGNFRTENKARLLDRNCCVRSISSTRIFQIKVPEKNKYISNYIKNCEARSLFLVDVQFVQFMIDFNGNIN